MRTPALLEYRGSTDADFKAITLIGVIETVTIEFWEEAIAYALEENNIASSVW